jgi:lipoprotein-releasing system ATP-binding protein
LAEVANGSTPVTAASGAGRTASPQGAGIYLKDVRKLYRIANQDVEALRGVDLRVPSGAIVALTGKSGAGKSTLLHIVGTLDRPTSGQIVLNGTDVTTFTDQAASSFRNHSVGFVFQMNNLLHEFSARENVMLPGLIGGAPKTMVLERATKLLTAVGLAHRLDHRPGELSGGEQQRVAIARALVMAPPILLADEPTGNLDQKTSLAIQDLLMQVCRENNVTMVLVTHDMDLARRMPAQIVMEDGRVVEGGGFH